MNQPKKKKKKTKRYYFTQETEDAIIEYNSSDDPVYRDKLYVEKIKYPFDKIAENMINAFKFPYIHGTFKDKQHDVVTFLLEKIHKYQGQKGRAFSYFSIVAKHYLIAKNNDAYDELKSMHHNTATIDTSRKIIDERVRAQKKEDDIEFFDLYIEYCIKNSSKIFHKDRDIQIANAIMELFMNRENIEIFNKKALYISIREMTGIKTQYITKVTNVLKDLYFKLRLEFEDTDTIKMEHNG